MNNVNKNQKGCLYNLFYIINVNLDQVSISFNIILVFYVAYFNCLFYNWRLYEMIILCYLNYCISFYKILFAMRNGIGALYLTDYPLFIFTNN